jgi:hypothetical protein
VAAVLTAGCSCRVSVVGEAVVDDSALNNAAMSEKPEAVPAGARQASSEGNDDF